MTLALFFDMRPKPGHLDHYFAHVDRLRPHLARHDGLLDLERFRRLDDPQAILSHQHWRDEAAILAWRRDREHRKSQVAGRSVHFEEYRIRIGPLIDLDSRAEDSTSARFVVTLRSAIAPATPSTQDMRHFESVTRPGHFLSVAAASSLPEARAIVAGHPGTEAGRIYAITRDYGMTERAEAPDPE
ncbi:antibiotic biosynthesis monooxygenase family protein [Anianabacter salinae]|uniref:antibiotic biosynthesis monooxygenase family protein n=1 Tax=Anianabacter salinae TaxID=2851023 RepID=UPI00225DF1F0|nr:antibiotic biosynthesis monooxygenase family protein [Anianabacter salinae]MBV0911134.1 antibiotic biosynthesis monooxygenase [Anianabacter salinae]